MNIFDFKKRFSKTSKTNNIPSNTTSLKENTLKSGTDPKSNNSDTLPNGKTISEQQMEDYNIAIGKYPNDTPCFLGMKIVSSTVPPQENYSFLNDDEKIFFSAFYNKLVEAKFSPELVKLTRLSDGTFDVDYISLCYVGKIRLYKDPPTYAVIKKGNKKATKVFKVKEEAEIFSTTNKDYEIQIRSVESEFYMQYLIGMTSMKELNTSSLQQCIDTLPRWINYLNYCKRN